MKKIFITGTGTDIGKTIVSAGLLRTLRNRGIDAIPMKPVQSGAIRNESGELTSPDIELSLLASHYDIPNEEKDFTCPYAYEPACSPHLAAPISKSKTPDMEIIKHSMESLMNLHEFTIVEGAGGIHVPLDNKNTMIDLIKKLDIPVLIVISNELGCINHALNTIFTLKQHNIEIIGGVMTHTTPMTHENSFIRDDNPKTISKFSSMEILSEIKFIPGFDPKKQSSWEALDDSFKLIADKITGDNI